MTAAYLSELREYLKQYTVTPANDTFIEQAAHASELIPAMVEAISDEDLEALNEQLWAYAMFSIISPPPSNTQEKEADDPQLITLTDTSQPANQPEKESDA